MRGAPLGGPASPRAVGAQDIARQQPPLARGGRPNNPRPRARRSSTLTAPTAREERPSHRRAPLIGGAPFINTVLASISRPLSAALTLPKRRVSYPSPASTANALVRHHTSKETGDTSHDATTPRDRTRRRRDSRRHPRRRQPRRRGRAHHPGAARAGQGPPATGRKA